jgi:hypothetical protein
MGYVLVLVLGLLVLGGLIVAFVSGGKKPQRGTLRPEQDKSYKKPSADAPTAAASSVESTAQVENARRHTPPA